MKIVNVCTQMEAGGAQKVAWLLTQGLAERGHVTSLLFLYTKRDAYGHLDCVRSLWPRHPRGPEYARVFWRLWRHLRKAAPDAVVTHGRYANALAQPVAWLARVPVRIAVHQSPAGSWPRPARWLNRLIGTTRLGGYHVAVSCEVLHSLTASCPALERKTIVIYNAGAWREPREAAAAPPAARARPLALTVGRLARQKNHALLLEALTHLPGLHLAVLGEGELRGELEQQARRKGLSARVHFVGEVRPEQVWTFLAAADVFVLPSLFEGLSLALTEALSAGLPVVASDIAGNREALTMPDGSPAGLLVRPGDAEALARGLRRVLSDTALAQRLRRQSLEQSREFTPGRMLSRYENLLQERRAAATRASFAGIASADRRLPAADEVARSVRTVAEAAEALLGRHTTQPGPAAALYPPLSGDFALYAGATQPDLYGMADAVYVLHTLGRLAALTDRDSRRAWARRMLACQGPDGLFTLRNRRGHCPEHATAYALGALHLLDLDGDEDHLGKLRPIRMLRPLLTEPERFERWIGAMGFSLAPRSLLRKRPGWHHVWQGSHVGGGGAAAVHMCTPLLESWWAEDIDIRAWFERYFDWLDTAVNPATGLWQRAFWNVCYRRPTLIDLGGAAHFQWLYSARKRPWRYPAATIESTLSLQRAGGLYRDKPFCIDLDADFSLVRSFLLLPGPDRARCHERVLAAVEANFCAVLARLANTPLPGLYGDTHGLPGALAALCECSRMPGFSIAGALSGWQHPLDRVCWL